MASTTSSTSSRLLQPLKIGNMQLSSRIVMAPLTRIRADDSHVPIFPLVADYYSQRASVPGTLLISEATFISPQASGYPNVPGIWNSAQAAGWKKVTDAVHAKGSYIYLQLWALGRTANQQIKTAEGTGDVVSSSAEILEGDGHTVPRPLTEQEIGEYIQQYAEAARRAVDEAGFDGVEVHGANGYLVDQFLQDVVNKRTDGWGGSVEKRSRFAIEVTKAVVAAVGPERVGIRLSPWGTFQGMRMADPVPQFSHVIGKLAELKLAYLHLVESRVDGAETLETRSDVSDPLIEVWGKTSPILLAGGFKPDIAKETVDIEYKKHDIAIVFGRWFISTPDLVFRIQRDIELNPYDRNTFYLPKVATGYTDYPFSEEFLKEQAKVAA